MKANVLFSFQNLDELYFSEKTVVIVDILRSTSTIVYALNNGAKEVIPVATMEFARKIAGGHNILAGERNSKKLDGFELGNSPVEFVPEIVEGMSIIFLSTNGSKAIVKAKFAENLLISTFLNLLATSKKLLEIGKDFEILCAGNSGFFCMEDTIFAGKLIREIQKINPELELTDSAKTSIILSDVYGDDIYQMLTETEHGKELVNLGLESDFEIISRVNSIDIVPIYESGSIKVLK